MFKSDPNTTLVKLRQLGEALAQDIASKLGISSYEYKDQYELIALLEKKLSFSYKVRDLFHTLRKDGNRAVHEFTTSHHQAVKALKNAYKLSIWYHGTFGDVRDFKVKAFVLPTDPTERLRKIQNEQALLKAKLLEHKERLEENKELAKLKEQENEEYNELIETMRRTQLEQKEFMEQQELEFKEQERLFEHKIAELSCSISDDERKRLEKIYGKKGDEVLCLLHLDEDETVELIEMKLNEAGWEADSSTLDYQKGRRPEDGKNMAIAKWACIDPQTETLFEADYVLFIGLKPVAIVEAIIEGKDVKEGIETAEACSSHINLTCIRAIAENEGVEVALDEWYSDVFEEKTYRVPMVFSTNGREYQNQQKTKSGIWFRDLRRVENRARVLVRMFSPNEIAEFLDRNDENLVRPKNLINLGIERLKKILF